MVSLAATSVENTVVFIAGTVGLAGILLGLIAVVALKRELPYGWAMGFTALLLGSVAGAGGLWKVSGESGLIFLAAALAIVLVVWGLLALFYRFKVFAEPNSQQGDQDTSQ